MHGYDPVPDSLDLHIATTSTDTITFHVEGTNGVFYTGTVALDSSTTVNLNLNYVVTDSSYSNRNKGIRVYTENGSLISVLVVNNNNQAGSMGDYAAYPYQQLNVQQYVYYTISTRSIVSYTSSLTLLVGTANDTTVIITPSQNIIIPTDIQNSSPDFTLQAGIPHTITLNHLQTFLFEANNVDLTGSKIVSDKPLTVVSGHECSNVPADVRYCEATSVQVPPTATWGTKFLLTPHGGRTGGQYYKMVAAEADTSITRNCNGGVSFNVLVGEGGSLSFSTPSGTYCYAESDKPVFTVIFGTGGSLNRGIGDPVMSLIPSIDMYAHSDILFYVPSYSGFYSHWINIMSTEPNPEILMNGQVLSLSWTTINDNNRVPAGYAAQMSLSEVGVDHYISSDAPITTLVYGWGDDRGLSYTAGVELKQHISSWPRKFVYYYIHVIIKYHLAKLNLHATDGI